MLFWGLWHLYWRRRQRPCEPIFTRKIRGLRFVTFWNLMRWCDERNMDDTVAHVTGLMLAHVHCRQVKKPGKWSLRLGRKTYEICHCSFCTWRSFFVPGQFRSFYPSSFFILDFLRCLLPKNIECYALTGAAQIRWSWDLMGALLPERLEIQPYLESIWCLCAA